MATIREVHDAFETMISEQGELASRLDQQKRSILEQRQEPVARQAQALRGALGRLVGGFEAPVLAKLDDMLGKRGAEALPGKLYSGLKAAKSKAKDALEELGNPAKPVETAEQLDAKQRKHQTEANRLGELRTQLVESLQGVDEQEKLAMGKGMPAFSDTEYWGSFRLGKWLTSATWRKARSTALNWQAPHGTMDPDGPQHCLEARKQVKRLASQIDAEQAKAQGFADQSTVRGLHDQLLTDSDMRSKAMAATLEQIIGNRRLIEAVARMLPEADRDAILTRQAKIEGLETLANGLQTRIDGANQIKSDLERPMRNLRRGKRSRPSRSLPLVDLEDIKKRVATGMALNTLAISHAAAAAGDIGRWQPSATQRNSTSRHDTGTLDGQMALMLAFLIMSDNNDNFFTATVFDGAADVAQDVGVDLGEISPDVSGLDIDASGLGDADLSGLGDIKVDISSTDIGSINVGSIDVPTIDTGSMGGGFDGGGFGGGFDGGGGF